jgi:enterochelin esterase-like enzyme
MAVWLAVGLYGLASYAEHYYTYRGFAAPRDPRGVAHGERRTVRFFSAALGQERRYVIYLPPGYAAAAATGRRFPVLYLLHGSPGWPRLFFDAGRLGVDYDTLLHQRRIRPFLIVVPDGRDGSFRSDTEWANTPHGRYEDFVLDVVGAVDRRWATLPRRRDRALAGNSEGAYAAVNLALHHLSMFGSAQSWSGYFVQTREGPFKHATRALLAANSPADYLPAVAPRLRRLGLRTFLYTGARDHELGDVRSFAAQLRAVGAKVGFAVYPGRHSWALWRAQTPHMLRLASAWFFGAPTPARVRVISA